jgi:UPF0042 nucleotide-binding protein
VTDEAPADTYPSGFPRAKFVVSENRPEVLIVTGKSGAGKSTAADVLSDLGWYVVDNMPPQMLGEMVTMAARERYSRLAAIVDARGGAFFKDIDTVLDDMVDQGLSVRLVFLDAKDDELVRRFEQVRRPHPLQGDQTLLEAIRAEGETLRGLRDRADAVIDTSSLTVHQLADAIVEELGAGGSVELQVSVQSFGFRNGTPPDADFVGDVRFLDNPHWDPQLRPLTGLDAAVRERVENAAGAAEFVDAYVDLVRIALESYRAHDKHRVSIAVGCTGGRHRSVAIAEAVGRRLSAEGYTVTVHHRDIPKADDSRDGT